MVSPSGMSGGLRGRARFAAGSAMRRICRPSGDCTKPASSRKRARKCSRAGASLISPISRPLRRVCRRIGDLGEFARKFAGEAGAIGFVLRQDDADGRIAAAQEGGELAVDRAPRWRRRPAPCHDSRRAREAGCRKDWRGRRRPGAALRDGRARCAGCAACRWRPSCANWAAPSPATNMPRRIQPFSSIVLSAG